MIQIIFKNEVRNLFIPRFLINLTVFNNKNIKSKNMKRVIIYFTVFSLITLLTNCKTIAIPEGATAVDSFNLEKYLGTWYEIARIDFKFEKDLDNTTATYSLREDGKVKVVNRGYNVIDNKWQDVEGKARFRGSTNVAELEVSFFGPFYAGYNVIAIKGDYEYALIAGSDTNYLWILSRSTIIPDDIKNQFLEEAKRIGYDVSRLNWIVHD